MRHPEPSRALFAEPINALSRVVKATEVRSAGTVGHVAWHLFACGIALYMVLSSHALVYLGIPYDTPTGSIAARIHPGTWLVISSYLLLLSSRGNPLKFGIASLAAEPLLGAYVLCQFAVLLWVIFRYGGNGATNIVETLIMPFFCVATARMIGADRRYRLLKLIMTILVLNTLIGLTESMLHTRLIPLRIGGVDDVVEDFFRPSALLGHPLTNSMITATLLPAALCLRLSIFFRVALMLLLWVGILAFGGRTSFLLATTGFGGYFLARIAIGFLRGRYSYLEMTGGAAAAMATGAFLAVGITMSGVGERIFHSLEWDGSAAVRLHIWSVLDYLSGTDLLLGVSPAQITGLGTRLGLSSTEAIENFWLVMFLLTGWVGFLPFVVAMACVFVWLLKSTRGAMRIAVLIFFAVCSSNNSLATKAIDLSLFMTVVVITRRRPAVP